MRKYFKQHFVEFETVEQGELNLENLKQVLNREIAGMGFQNLINKYIEEIQTKLNHMQRGKIAINNLNLI